MLLELWRAAAHTLEPAARRVSAAEHRIDLVTGGVLEMWSLTEPDVARGRKYARVVVDEAAMIPNLLAAWEEVIRPTLADYRGDAWFLSTPRGFNDYHRMYEWGQSPDYPDWMSWQMPTHSNPHISRDELDALERSMTDRRYRQEILASFEAENEGALWRREWIDESRVRSAPEHLARVVVAIDPSGSKRGDDVGLVVAALGADSHVYVLDDLSGKLGPDEWARRALVAYDDHHADRIVAEANFGGEMVQSTIVAAGKDLGIVAPVKLVHASRGKAVRAEPIAVRYRNGEVHHVGRLPALENEMCLWSPMDAYSPGRVDALVWCCTDLLGVRPAPRVSPPPALVGLSKHVGIAENTGERDDERAPLSDEQRRQNRGQMAASGQAGLRSATPLYRPSRSRL